jgi:hypothetical protein
MADGDVTPNYEIKCDVCEQTPTVDVESSDGKIIHTELCGPCCFGEASAIDPKEW